MKKKIVIINLLMSLIVLFAMLFQTIHSYEHIYKQITAKHCNHKYVAHEKQFTHSHEIDHNCPICHFAFSTFIPDAFQSFSFYKKNIETAFVFFCTKTALTYFNGSLFALRAPPSIK